jgi:hypothetical protein
MTGPGTADAVRRRAGVLPPDSTRILGTTAAGATYFGQDRFVIRYDPAVGTDSVGGAGGHVPVCSARLLDACALADRRADAASRFARLPAPANDVGRLREDHDTGARTGRRG